MSARRTLTLAIGRRCTPFSMLPSHLPEGAVAVAASGSERLVRAAEARARVGEAKVRVAEARMGVAEVKAAEARVRRGWRRRG